MRKRLIEKFTKAKKGSLGYTLTELLVVIGIIAIICAIAIPSIIAISRSLRFRQRNDYAKSIFLAAQQNLTEMRSDGGLRPLQAQNDKVWETDSGFPVDEDNGPKDGAQEYRAVVSTVAEMETAFNIVLPVGSIDAAVRDDQIIIEYNPITGNVYAVFYCDEDDVNIAERYYYGSLPRDAKEREELMVGYYEGSVLNSSEIEVKETKATVEFLNGQEGIVRIEIPMPDNFFGKYTYSDFVRGLNITLRITGEQGLAPNNRDLILTVPAYGNELGDAKYSQSVDGKSVIVEYPIDSLKNCLSFANHSSHTSATTESVRTGTESKPLVDLPSESVFDILPGENITIQAEPTFSSGDGSLVVDIKPGIVSGVNPMFDYLQPTRDKDGNVKYVLAVSNGRNLQNLNALSATIAKNVTSVVFVDDIYWNETVAYYKNYSNASAEAPARALPYFVPIHNAELFGTAHFEYEEVNEILSLGDNALPQLTDQLRENRKPIIGNVQREEGNTFKGAYVYDLNIDTTKYATRKDFYAGDTSGDGTKDVFTGLFGYVNTSIDNIHVVNPVVKGADFDGTNNPATGALVGAAGSDTYISNCSTFVTSNDSRSDFKYGYVSAHADYNSDPDAEQKWYGVSGAGSVGGLVGYAKSHKTTNAENLTNDSDVLAFNGCFAAVNVSGKMREAEKTGLYYKYAVRTGLLTNLRYLYGYTNGVGGFIGNSEITNFYRCYASGNVKATNANGAKALDGGLNITQYYGRESAGAGGFVGSSHGTRYTNCFATGNVSSNCYSGNHAVGGFVGVMCIDENFAYDNENIYGQNTVFENCYSIGVSKVNGLKTANFSGLTARIKITLDGLATNALRGYYHQMTLNTHARGCNTVSVPTYESTYLFKNTYFLSLYSEKEDGVASDANSSLGYVLQDDKLRRIIGGADPENGFDQFVVNQFDFLKDQPLFGEWLENPHLFNTHKPTELIDEIMRTLELQFPNAYNEKYYEEQEKEDIWPGVIWGKATNTISFDRTGAYPYPMLTDMPYYGSWPMVTQKVGMAYYEQYDNRDNTFYYFDSESTSMLEYDDDTMVVKDGYAIMATQGDNITVSIDDGEKVTLTQSDTFTADIRAYSVFHLTEKLMKEATEYTQAEENKGKFYVPVTVTQGSETYTLYFNPNVARAHLPEGDTATAPVSKTMFVRSARQLNALKNMQDYMGAGYAYEQQLNVDAGKYNWEEYTGVTSGTAPVLALGSDEAFNATYYSAQNEIVGFQPGASGYFGQIGSDGAVHDVTFHVNTVSVGASDAANAAVLVGANHGAVRNVDLVLNGEENSITVTAAENAGILAGYTDGVLEDCDVTVAEGATANVMVTAANAGGLIGQIVGAPGALVSADGSSFVLNGELELEASANAGGLFGKASYVSLDSFNANLNGLTVSGGGVGGGLVGAADHCDITSGTITLNGAATNAGGTMAGAVASAANTTFTAVNVKLDKFAELSGSNVAGLVNTAKGVTAVNCTLNLDGKVAANGGNAAGAVGIMTDGSGFTDVTVNLAGHYPLSATGGNAAGFVCNVAPGSTVQNGIVKLENSIIYADMAAAGFACQISGYVANSNVVGKTIVDEDTKEVEFYGGHIKGNRAAGFVCDVVASDPDKLTEVTGCHVSPASKDEEYAGNTNKRLKVTDLGVAAIAAAAESGDETVATSVEVNSNAAAGFALTVSKDATVGSSYALCAVMADNVYGFVGLNEGIISRGSVNVDLELNNDETGVGYTFVGKNTGTLTTSYGWYNDIDFNANISPEGLIVNSYFGDLDDSRFNDVDCIVVFDEKGDATEMSAADLKNVTIEKFLPAASYGVYPYNVNLLEADGSYPYPMLRTHYGDWITAPQYSYGVAYYETYTDGPAKVHMVDLSNPNITVEGKANKVLPDEAFILSSGTEEPFGVNEIVSDGYAVFMETGADELKNYRGEELTQLSYTNKDLSDITYKFYKFVTTEDVVRVIGSKTSATVDTRFADAINDTDGTYEIRTAEHLNNIGKVAANFNQTNNISGVAFTAEDDLRTIAAEKTYNGNKLDINVTGTNAQPVFNTVSGTVKNVSVHAGEVAVGANDVYGVIIGEMTGGELMDSDAHGKIIRGANADDTHIVGGVVGKMSGGAKASGVTSEVTVDAALAYATPGTTDKTFGPNAAALYKGPVGMFVGEVGNATLSNCKCIETEASTNKNVTFQFLGQAQIDVTPFTPPVWWINGIYADTIETYSDYIDSSGNTLRAEIAEGGNVKEIFFTKSNETTYVPATLNGCRFVFKGETVDQNYGVGTYYKNSPGEQARYEYTAQPLNFKPDLINKEYNAGKVGSLDKKDDGLYYLHEGKYHRVYVDGELKVDWQTKFYFRVRDSITGAVLAEKAVQWEWNKEYKTTFEMYNIVPLSLNGLYLAIGDENGAWGSDSKQHDLAQANGKFEQRDSYYKCLWSISNNRIRNLEDTTMEYDLVAQPYQQDKIMRYKVNNREITLYPVEEYKADYELWTLSALTDLTRPYVDYCATQERLMKSTVPSVTSPATKATESATIPSTVTTEQSVAPMSLEPETPAGGDTTGGDTQPDPTE